MADIIVNRNSDEYSWLRNDYESPVAYLNMREALIFPSVEHAFQAMKTDSVDIRRQIACSSVKDARRIGRSLPLRPDWDLIKTGVMTTLVRFKFYGDQFLSEKLLKTGNDNIVIGSRDSFWGIGNDGQGENTLGTILMLVRKELGYIRPDLVPEADEEKAESSILKDALYEMFQNEEEPDDVFLDACQGIYDGVKQLMTLVDAGDFDEDIIQARFEAAGMNVSLDYVKDAVKKLRATKEALATMAEYLEDDVPDAEQNDDMYAQDATWDADDDGEYLDEDDEDDDAVHIGTRNPRLN